MTDLAEHEPTSEPASSEPEGGARDGTSLSLDRVVFGVAASIIVVFVVYGGLRPEAFSSQTSEALGWLTANFGWLFVLTSAMFVLFAGYLAVTRYGNIRLGPDDAEPFAVPGGVEGDLRRGLCGSRRVERDGAVFDRPADGTRSVLTPGQDHAAVAADAAERRAQRRRAAALRRPPDRAADAQLAGVRGDGSARGGSQTTSVPDQCLSE